MANVACGGLADIETIIPVGGDPHGYEPSLQDRARMESASLVVANGLGLEEGLADTLEAVADSGTPVFAFAEAMDSIPFRFESAHEDDHEDDHEGHDHDDEAHEDDHDDHEGHEDDHDDHEGHDHDDEAHEDDHDDHEGHDHDDEAHEDDHDDHEGHDHDDEAHEDDHDDHEGHDHDDEAHEDDHDDHEGHDHDDEAHEDDHDDHEGHDHDDEAHEDDHDDHEGHDHDDEAHEDDHDDHEGHDHDDEAHEDDHDDHEGHDHSGGDPHVWFDPHRVSEALPALADTLKTEVRLDAAAVEACLTSYQAELAAVDAEIAARIDQLPADSRKLVTNHEALGYFADRYGFEVIGTVIPTPASMAQASPAQLEELAEMIEHEGVKALFAETVHSTDDVEALASRVGDVEVVTLYTGSLGPPGSGADTYIGFLQTNTDLIVDALG